MCENQTFDIAAQYYDLFELKSQPMYENIVKILDTHFTQRGVTSVLDFACGTGEQAIPLSRKGYHVTAIDISPEMLRVARQKGSLLADISWGHGDMRESQIGTFDAAIAMLNATSYLNPSDFIRALRNVRLNLAPSGIFVFDNANLEALRAGGLSTEKSIDAVGEHQGKKYVRFCQSTVDLTRGRLMTQWEAYVQEGFQTPEQFSGTWNRQVYTCDELEQILAKEGFQIVQFYDRYGGVFDPKTTFSVLVVAERLEAEQPGARER